MDMSVALFGIFLILSGVMAFSFISSAVAIRADIKYEKQNHIRKYRIDLN
jgi:hypothetical protein